MWLSKVKMIVQKDFLAKLKDFGLNSYESKLWTALLSRGISTAGELSDIANVPRSRTYDVLESLEKKGFIIMKLGKPIKYLAVSPSEVVDRVKKKIDDDAKTHLNMLDTLKESQILEELMLLHNQGVELVEPSDYSGIIKGRNNIYNHLEAMIKSAKNTVSINTTEKGLIRKHEALYKVIEKANKRGVKVNIKAPMTKNNTEYSEILSKVSKVNPTSSSSRFCVVDGKEILFMLMDDEAVHPNFEVGIWVNAPLFAGDIEKDVFQR